MDVFGQKLNELLVGVYRQINKIEEKALKQLGPSDLSINELHLLEAVGKDRKNGRTVSDIACDQDITLPSVTAAVNKLMKKGYVEKIKAEHDGRVVYVRLTRLGRKMNAGHQYFHENMVRNLSDGMSEEEKEVLIEGIQKLRKFLYRNLEEIEEHRLRSVRLAEAALAEEEEDEE